MALSLAVAGLLGSGIGAAASVFGQSSANKANKREAEKNRQFQEYMSSTAHQREIKDLKKAGLNPILSATGGRGASTPGGSMARIENTAKDLNKNVAATSLLAAQLGQIKATTSYTNEQTQLAAEQQMHVRAQAQTQINSAVGLDLENRLKAEMLKVYKVPGSREFKELGIIGGALNLGYQFMGSAKRIPIDPSNPIKDLSKRFETIPQKKRK